jgi:hypothetical protein
LTAVLLSHVDWLNTFHCRSHTSMLLKYLHYLLHQHDMFLHTTANRTQFLISNLLQSAHTDLHLALCRVKVFVGNVPWTTDDDNTREFFKDCGEIEEIFWIEDKESGKFKGEPYRIAFYVLFHVHLFICLLFIYLFVHRVASCRLQRDALELRLHSRCTSSTLHTHARTPTHTHTCTYACTRQLTQTTRHTCFHDTQAAAL